MYKMFFEITILSLLERISLLADSSVFKFKGTCAYKHTVCMMMGELPLHFAGAQNCVESIQFKCK